MSETNPNPESQERKFDCAVCGLATDSIKQLKTHILLKHSGKLDF